MTSTASDVVATSAAAAPRVVLLTSPGLFGAEIINRLAADEGTNLVGVGLTNRLYKGKGLVASAQTFLQRTGWRYLWYNVLQSQVAWIRLRLSGRPQGLKRVAGQVRPLHDVNSPDTIAWVASLSPDYVASFFFNQLIGAELRRVPGRGCVNMHPSLLPALRGPDPIFRAIERGLGRSGHTIHEIADAIDAGRVLFQRECTVPANVTAFGLYLQMVREGADLLADWLSGRLQTSSPAAASTDDGDYNTFPTPAEVRRFYRSGHRLITIRELHRAIAEIE